MVGKKDKQNDDFNNVLHNSSGEQVLTHYFSSFLIKSLNKRRSLISATKLEMFLNKRPGAYWRIYGIEIRREICHILR